MARREFSVAGTPTYDHRSAFSWIRSHLLRYRRLLALYMVSALLANLVFSVISTLTGTAFNAVLRGDRTTLTHTVLVLLGVVLLGGCIDLSARWMVEFLGKRFARDARDELYLSLLGKSQTFHNRQRVGDIMARAANDVGLLSDMIVPGADVVLDSSLALVVPIVFIGFLQPQLLLAPLLFTVVFILALRDYVHRLEQVSDAMRGSFGALNARLAETVSGIDVVKATAQEGQERRVFSVNARRYRDLFVKNGRIQAFYVPPLLLAVTFAGAFLHGLYLVSRGSLTPGGLVTYLGLLGILRFPATISLWSLNLVQQGFAAARRILAIIAEEADLDENDGGYRGEMRGAIIFDHVSFAYGAAPVLRDISFTVEPGMTVAIVGQTGAGKSTLTRLVNRIYEVSGGHVLVDGVDVRDWSMAALRGQIASIEQDVFLFSRTIAENIAFGLGGAQDRAAIEQAARDAQAHEFIMGFRDGYDTVIGERGVTLSGGQRQRIAIARALLTDPRILILDDSTSAVDSATEDEIQQAMRRLLRGRATLLITPRLSQIRTADWVLLLRRGEIVDQGTHTDLLARSDVYRRIFAHYEPALPAAAGAAHREI